MKNRILVFLVFITTILKGQSVDPETFPTVVGSVLGKNVYTNTGGEGKFSVQSIADEVNILDTISATYAEFYTLITGGNLQVGRTYILVDFQTVYDQMDFDAGGSLKPTLVTKTGATEQIWVYALSNNQIASKAYSATYPNDQIQYDWTYNTTFVNGAPAKGRISERIDENNNRTDYDHREIKFIRYDDGAGNFTVINDNGNASGEFLTFVQNFTGGTVKDNWLGDFYSVGASVGQEYANNVFHGSFVVSNTSSALFHTNTFSGDVNSNTFSGYNVNNNTFSGDVNSNTFSGGDVYSNTFSGEVNTNTFSGGMLTTTHLVAMFTATHLAMFTKTHLLAMFTTTHLIIILTATHLVVAMFTVTHLVVIFPITHLMVMLSSTHLMVRLNSTHLVAMFTPTHLVVIFPITHLHTQDF